MAWTPGDWVKDIFLPEPRRSNNLFDFAVLPIRRTKFVKIEDKFYSLPNHVHIQYMDELVEVGPRYGKWILFLAQRAAKV
jgi:hypothetical protein